MKSKSIAVICSYPPTRNTGMVTVDLSAYVFLSKHYPEAEIVHYVLGDLEKIPFSGDELPFRYVDMMEQWDTLLASDVIIFWGDFLHAPAHWRWDVYQRLISHGKAASIADAEDLVYKFHMFEDAPDSVLHKLVIFGSTIITNNASDMANPRYGAALERILAKSAGIFFRDAISAVMAAPARTPGASLGIDCALLLETDDLQLLSGYLPPRKVDRKRLGVFFGRTSWIGSMLVFSRMVAARARLDATWIPWLETTLRRRRWVAKLAGYPAEATPFALGEIASRLQECDAVISDTYHLCVNAWRLGIPAICIGRGASGTDSTLADKKKEIFYAMYGARKFYLFTESLGHLTRMRSLATYVAKILADHKMIEQISVTMLAQRQASSDLLLETLHQLLDRSDAKIAVRS